MGNTATLDQSLLATPGETIRTSAQQAQFIALCASFLGFLYYGYQTAVVGHAYIEAQETMGGNPFAGLGQGLLQMRLESVGSSAVVFAILCVVLWGFQKRG